MRRLKVAMTGTRGLVGSLLAERLEGDEQCRKLVLLDLVPPKKKLRKSSFHRVDLTDPLASNRIADVLRKEEPDVVVHLAFLKHPIRNPTYPHELESVGTMHLLHALGDAVRAGRRPGLVVESSTMAYGALPENPNFLTEDAPLRGRRGYPLVEEKIDAERQIESFQKTAGISAVVLRTAPLLGGGYRTLASRYLSLPAVPTVMGFNPLVQLLHPEDAVEAFFLAIHSAGDAARHRVYNVASPQVLPLLAAVRLAGRRSLPLPAVAAMPMIDGLFQAGAAIAPGAHLPYLRYPCVADVGRAAKELGFAAAHSTKDCVVSFARTKATRAAA
jgi:UDP-glucose 4-epimerase